MNFNSGLHFPGLIMFTSPKLHCIALPGKAKKKGTPRCFVHVCIKANLFTILKYGRTTLSDWLPVLLEKYWSREEHQNKEFYYNGFVTLEVRDVTRVLLRWLAGA
jgi:hypothetical protein